jgi:antitoxin component YwqK of YwqJK toxin-antitoxin module
MKSIHKYILLLCVISGCIKQYKYLDSTNKPIFKGYYIKFLNDSTPIGMWKEYYVDSGVTYLAVKEKVTFDSLGDIVYNGKKISYYKNGNKREIAFYNNDILYGTYKYYYLNGNVKVIKKYSNNIEFGAYKKYDVEGKLVESGDFCGNGRAIWAADTTQNIDSLNNLFPVRCGIWKEFSSGGNITGVGEYENYVIIEKQFMDKHTIGDSLYEFGEFYFGLYHKKGVWTYYPDNYRIIKVNYIRGEPVAVDTVYTKPRSPRDLR